MAHIGEVAGQGWCVGVIVFVSSPNGPGKEVQPLLGLLSQGVGVVGPGNTSEMWMPRNLKVEPDSSQIALCSQTEQRRC